ncbi:phosphate ABC transporter substrate-binding protein [Heliorestis acidaminivorans]|uniref:Phosphate-binding protein n=1 Tax=Heliorestis acidaminivorans TaxID=553427 RepID=A0A6I0F6P8_9FIRM|nr:phosphate ABC transporter substrate-binding protein [Heliorestis acidaminivorans]KAB2954507.1 phosphate ABC transporter substrate-binding protein [Heliorestis acidaminivorans]
MSYVKKFSKVIGLTVITAMVGAVAVGCSGDQSQSNSGGDSTSGLSGTIQVRGSDTLVNLSQAFAEDFMDKYPNVSIAVTGGGSGTGISALINGTADLANSSRDIKDNEINDIKEKTGKDVVEYDIALDGIGFIVHKDNPVKELTMEQLKGIYTGKVTNWSELGGPDQTIVPLARETSSGTHVFVKEFVLDNEEYRPDALLQTSSATIAKEIETNTGAIGYVGMGYLTDKVQTIAVKKDDNSPAVLPSDNAVKDGSYPVSRPLHVYSAGEPEGVAKAFVEFMLSPEGQKIVGEMEFVPVK